MPESADTAVAELLRERVRLDAELARHQEAVTVLFVDIVGSTRFYEQYGDVAGLTMVQQFLDQLSPIIQQHGGIVVKTIGDAILARFACAIDGVRCALNMQWSLLQYNEGRVPMEQIHIRVALNSGFALLKGTDVFGDVVNVCSRIESMADPGDILLSPSAYDQICQYEEIAVRKHAEGVQLKGKAEKLDLYEVVWRYGEPITPAPPRPSESQIAMAALPQALPAQDAAVPVPSPAEVAAPPRRVWSRPVILGAVGGALLLALGIVALIGGLFFSSRTATALSEKDTIVLADFDNKTGDPVFDDTLKQALAVDLEQSPFLNILSHRKVMTTLLMMGRSPERPVIGRVARDLCQRVGSKALLAGSITSLGNDYVIGLEAVNCATGDALVTQQVEAHGKENVLKALGKAATAMRSKLGESLASVQEFGTPIEEATTSSLDALKAFSMARRTAATRGEIAAIPYFQRALELDPHFAGAYGELALMYSNQGQTTRAVENITRSYELRDRVSERERYSFTCFYHLIATGDLAQANEAAELWKQSYPRDFQPRGDLGSNYAWLGQWERALSETQEAFRLEPNNGTNIANLAWEQLALGRTLDAKTTLEQALSRNVDTFFVRLALYHVAFLLADQRTMQEQVAALAGRPGEEDLLQSAQADTDAYFGRLGKARALSSQAVESARRADAAETAALWQAKSALREVEFGNARVARQQATSALALLAGREVQPLAALALARSGETAQAQKLADALDHENPQNTILQGYWLPTIRAALEMNRNPAKAVEILQAAAPYDLSQPPSFNSGVMYPVYLRGEAYLHARQGKEAAAEFQKIIDHGGLVLNFPLGALAHLGLARAHAQQGEPQKARAAYQEFLTLWKDADPDVPILRQAKAEMQRLP